MLYCDNAATSFPKPPAVYEAVLHYMQHIGASPGRSSHTLTQKANHIIFNTREKCSALFNAEDSSRIVFTSNATESINYALFGLLKPGDRVAVTTMEHNSIMRPLRFLQQERHIKVIPIPCTLQGRIDLEALNAVLKTGIQLVVVNHASNVCGTIQPLDAIGADVHAHRALLMVDAAQSAGLIPIDVQAMNIDLLAFSGHKALYGPQGTGGLYIRNGLALQPLKYGGTGSRSDSDEQPDFMPDSFECGTLNGPGIAGLGAGIDFILQQGLLSIRRHGIRLTEHFIEAVRGLPGIHLHGTNDPYSMVPTLSLTVNNRDPAYLARRLNDDFGICCRMGLHCAPQAHRTLGTFPNGTLRVSFGWFNTQEDVETVAASLQASIS